MNNSAVTPRYPPLSDLLTEVATARTFGGVATHLLRVTEDAPFATHDLAAVISADQTLTSRLLRLAHSSFFELPRRITTVREAVVQLGFREVRSAMLASCVIEALPGAGRIPLRQFWHFSVVVAIIAESFGGLLHQRSDDAFAAGVLHNVGRLALDQCHPDMLALAIRTAVEARTSVSAAERELFGYSDADLGAGLVGRWNFPADVVDAVAHHELSLDALPDAGSLTATVARARLVARSSGMSDGVEAASVRALPVERDGGALSSHALALAGGIESVRQRAAAFLDHALNA